MTPGKQNRLAREPSLYLRQHAHNPVDWYPWGVEALRRARADDRPILLSIGYSACHWCHVMERECFEDPAIAEAMNESFVCVKVDREERPDLDSIYMQTVQLLTGRGGWPMTVFLLPDLRPFYAGTYFPPEDRGGMPGFPRVLAAVNRAFHEEREKLEANGAHLLELLVRDATGAAGRAAQPLSREALLEAGATLLRGMDPEFGGFGRAPKFPNASSLNFLLGLERSDPHSQRKRLLRTTLDSMANGGVYDQIGGGFHRYSVDPTWSVPHFEKMLYDQALLAETYAAAAMVFDEPRYAETAAGVLDYVAREMTGSHGAFWATQDADSEGEEGRFYLWSRAEIRSLVDARDADLVCEFFGVSEDGNFENQNVLRRAAGVDELARRFERASSDVERSLRDATRRMLERRAKRSAPATDTKVLADWNGLMIGAMTLVGRRCGREDLVLRAARAADFVRTALLHERRLRHFYAEGEIRVDALLNDYAFVGRGCLELFFALGRREDLETARLCADAILADFYDPAQTVFYLTAAGASDLIVRARETHDGAVPAGAAVAAELLCRMYQITGHDPYARAAEEAVAAMLPEALANPHGASHILCVAHRSVLGYATVMVTTAAGDEQAAMALEAAALRTGSAEVSVARIPIAAPDWFPQMMRDKRQAHRRSAAYVCRGQVCLPAIYDSDALQSALGGAA